jgi:D-apiose dehydrogenase
MKDLRFAILGTGFWSQYQLAGWNELSGVKCVALYNRTRAKAEKLAARFGVPEVYEDARALLVREELDFVDIITDVQSHPYFVSLAAEFKVPVICQKPVAPNLDAAREMVEKCRNAGVPLAVHENWRWQRPIRESKADLESGAIGKVFRARIDYCNSFPVFENQPFLKELEQFILTDIGSHILDVGRFLFGEARTLYCQTARVHHDIKGEDVATVMMQMESGATLTCNMSYASRVEHDRFPETFIFIEGEYGSIELAPDYWLRVTTPEGTKSRRCAPPFYSWADARYALVHSSIVACNADLLRALRSGTPAETSGEDNLKTMQLVFASYDSAARNEVVSLEKYT